MNLTLSIRQLFHKPQHTLLNVILLATSVGIITMLGQVKKQFEDNIEKNKSGIDLVLGASGSPLQLVLSAVYQMDAPTGNIPLTEATQWMTHPMVAEAIPLAYGDNVKGFPIVGTTQAYPLHFGASLKRGQWHSQTFDVVIGSRVAQQTGLDVDSTFFGVHGLMEEGEAHDHQAYTVTGVLKPTGLIIDRLVLCHVESIWEMHDHDHDHDHEGAHDHDHSDCHDHDHDHDIMEEEAHAEITAVLLKMKSPMAKITFPGMVKKQTPAMQTALPEVEMNRLFSLLGIGIKAMQYLAILIMLISAFSVWLSLYSNLKERRYELAMIRVMGGSRKRLFAQLMTESVFLCMASYVAGVLLGIAGFAFVGMMTADELSMSFQSFSIDYKQQLYLFLTVMGLGFMAAIIPAIQAYTLSISDTLSNE